jgi:hypothetical protein
METRTRSGKMGKMLKTPDRELEEKRNRRKGGRRVFIILLA